MSCIYVFDGITDDATLQVARHRSPLLALTALIHGHDLTIRQATRSAVAHALRRSPSLTYLIFTGHGDASGIQAASHRLDDVLSSSDALRRFQNVSVMHVLACECARDLGQALVAAGLRAFVGYADVFLVNLNNPHPMLQAATVVDLELLSGATVGDAVLTSKRAGRAIANTLKKQKREQEAAMMRHNATWLYGPTEDAMLGDPAVRI